MNKTTLDWFRLINSRGVGPKTFWSLLRRHGTASKALQYIRGPYSEKEALSRLKKFDGKLLLAIEKEFPKNLKEIDNCPPILYYKGDLEILKKQSVAIIGARNASISARNLAFSMSKSLADNGLAVVSGLARGIDISAHRGAIKKSAVVAVMPFGVNHVYPKENLNYYNQILDNGIVISEVMDSVPIPAMFLARNRIIAGMSDCVVVIEAALKSGTLSAANCALDLGKDVLVVPGFPTDPRSKGSNMLIKNGAPLVENSYDILDVVFKYKSFKQKKIELKKTKAPTYDIETFREIVAHLSSTPTSLESLSRATKYSANELLEILSNLEMDGVLHKSANNEIVLLREL